jgi:hypothetical protein
MDRLTQQLSLTEPPVQDQDTRRAPGSASGSGSGTVNASSPHRLVLSTQIDADGGNGGSWNDDAVDDSGPAAIPASVVSEVTRHSPTVRTTERAKASTDIISRGVLTVEQAQLLFNYYMSKHDNYIYSVLEEGSTFAKTRNNSPFLLTAICAVASLHVLSPDIPYARCYEEFVHLSTSHAFSPRNNLDDIRALCIGAFWLPDISWVLATTGKVLIYLLVQKSLTFVYSCSYCH